MRKDFQKKGLPSIFSALGKRDPLPPKEEEIFVVVEIQKETIPSIEEMPFFDVTDSHGLRIITHRETGDMMLIKDTLKACIFAHSSCLEYTLQDTSGEEQTVGYVRGDISNIPEIVKEKFDFDPTHFEGYPKGHPRETETHTRAEYHFIDIGKKGKPKRQKVITEKQVKTREIWNGPEEWGFKLLIEHSVPLEELALFFQDTVRCMKERARSRGYWKILRIRELEQRKEKEEQEEEWKRQGIFLKDGVLMKRATKEDK